MKKLTFIMILLCGVNAYPQYVSEQPEEPLKKHIVAMLANPLFGYAFHGGSYYTNEFALAYKYQWRDNKRLRFQSYISEVPATGIAPLQFTYTANKRYWSTYIRYGYDTHFNFGLEIGSYSRKIGVFYAADFVGGFGRICTLTKTYSSTLDSIRTYYDSFYQDSVNLYFFGQDTLHFRRDYKEHNLHIGLAFTVGMNITLGKRCEIWAQTSPQLCWYDVKRELSNNGGEFVHLYSSRYLRFEYRYLKIMFAYKF